MLTKYENQHNVAAVLVASGDDRRCIYFTERKCYLFYARQNVSMSSHSAGLLSSKIRGCDCLPGPTLNNNPCQRLAAMVLTRD